MGKQTAEEMTEKDEIGFLDSLRESAEIQIILSFATEAEAD